MCGITGFASLDPDAPPRREAVRAMTASLVHRGPDAEGLWSGPGAALGHRRLSIIDIEGGAQPMATPDGRFTITFNGEIYNFRDLRDVLEGESVRFSTRSDTEVLLQAFARWGEECLPRVNGMFAFAVWDSRERTLTAARDPAGIKPLYYHAGPGGIFFASEIRALRAAGAAAPEIDLVALDQFLTYRYVPSPRTMLDGVRKLPPGHLLRWRAGSLEVSRFDRRVPRIDESMTQGEWIEALREALPRAVERQMVADVPVGVLLSGGIDSALVATLAARHATRLRTFTVGFEEPGPENELDAARETAERIGSVHEEVRISSGQYAEFLPRSVELLEEPIGTPSAVALHFVARLARRSVKVVLTGQGADEPLAGYMRHRGERLRPVLAPIVRNRAVASLIGRLPGSERVKRAAYALGVADIEERFLRTYALCSEPLKARLLRPEVSAELGTRRDLGAPIRPHLEVTRHLDPLSRMLFVDTRVWLPDDLLLYTDKMTMAVSLEARVPLLDLDLLRLVETMPPRHKLRGISSHKHLYKQAALRWLPRRTVFRKKKGFEAPVDRWFRHAMYDTVRSRFADPAGPLARFFVPEELCRLLEDHRSGREDRRRQIFSLYSLGLWLESALG